MDVWNAVSAHAKSVARLRARPHPHIRLALKRRHPARRQSNGMSAMCSAQVSCDI